MEVNFKEAGRPMSSVYSMLVTVTFRVKDTRVGPVAAAGEGEKDVPANHSRDRGCLGL